jgi:hypothetical protein
VSSEEQGADRARLVFTLRDSRHRPGEIPLAGLARIAHETQTLVRRLARSLDERSGAGRTPDAIDEMTELMLVEIHPGSTTLEVAGPTREPELNLGIQRSDDIGTRALDSFISGLDAIMQREPLPDAFDDICTRSLQDWLAAMAASTSDLRLEASIGDHAARSIQLAPAVARAELVRRRATQSMPIAPTQVVEGRLYAVDIDSGRYRIRDDAGNSIRVVTSGLSADHVAQLLDQQVRAEGHARLDEQGRLTTIEVTGLSPAPDVEGLDTASFFTGIELDRLLAETRPLDSVSELAIPGITDDEVADMLATLQD